MKKLLIIALLFVGCDFLEEDCAGDIGGNSVELWGVCYPIETTSINITLDKDETIPSDIGLLTNLTTFRVHSPSTTKNLIGNIPPEIGNLKKLTELTLMNSELSDTIPNEICNLSQLTYLNLYSNELIGTIPHCIQDLSNLQTLRLADNNLSGIIPNSICNLINLNWVNSWNYATYGMSILYDNNFCPPYPTCIEDLNNTSIKVWVGIQDTSNCN